jgi:uncharacterized protein with HEPN domain
MRKPRSNQDFLQDILIAIGHIEMDTTGMSFEQFAQMRQAQQATLLNLQIIGEAANRIEPQFRACYSSVPWSKAIAIRNRIVHGYFSINFGIIWETITKELPPLKAQIAAILEDIEGTE